LLESDPKTKSVGLVEQVDINHKRISTLEEDKTKIKTAIGTGTVILSAIGAAVLWLVSKILNL
jgi:hypothetical protein